MNVLVIGAGLFGTSVSLELAKIPGAEVELIESQNDIMKGASKCNHNRLHLGYHYLRSKPTAVQSIEGILSFMFNYGEAVIYQFPNYYAIAKTGSRTASEEFVEFCNSVGIGYDPEYPEPGLLDREMVDSCFKVPEPIFDYEVLRNIVRGRLRSLSNVRVRLGIKCSGIERKPSGFEVMLNGERRMYDVVVNATYHAINKFSKQLGLNVVPLRYEEVVIPYFLYPSDKIGLTVMDGEFCSIMPKGQNKNEFLLYHVKHSVLQAQEADHMSLTETPVSDIEIDRIYRESQEFYPFLKEVKQFGFWQTFRAVHENRNDARVTELITYDECDNYFSILSGKISTCMQVALELRHMIQGTKPKKRFII